MDRAEKLNQQLAQYHPAAFRCLSPLGKRLFFPQGVPVQAAEARNCRFNATIGQLLNDEGRANPLPSMSAHISGLRTEDVFQYQAQGGRKELRQLWRDKILREVGCSNISNPVVCMGLTQGLSIAGDLFVDEETDVLLPNPRWGNYDLIFGVRRLGNIINYKVMDGEGENPTHWSFNISGIAEAIARIRHKGVLVLNIPSNPVGYTPTWEEIRRLVAVIKEAKKPLVIVLDEAYKGMEWEDGIINHSLIQELSTLDPERFLVMKIDGATKEMFFFGGRIAFVTFVCEGEVAPVLEEKVIGSIRSSVSALPSPSQALTMTALQSSTLAAETTAIREMLRERYLVLKELLAHSSLRNWKYNSAFFALISAPNGAEETRLRLIEAGVGVVSVRAVDSIRLSYSTVPKEELEPMIRIIEKNI